MVAKEVRAAQLDQFSQLAANPMDAPYIKREELLRQRADAHDLKNVVKTEEEVMAEMNNPQTQMAQQLAQKTQELQIQTMDATLQKLLAEVNKLRAEAVNKNVASAYAAMQAAGVAVQSPDVAPGGDEILRSGGWQDATPNATTAQVVGPNPQPMASAPAVQPTPDSAGATAGMNRGMHTEALDG
jgi:DNA polymerase III gamma/tau subunit